MKNITLKIDDETYRRARMRAASAGTSISAMVREFLCQQADAEDARETRRIAALNELFAHAEARGKARGKARSKPLKPLTRDEIYSERLR
jgi:plasmid stability protein